MESNRQLDNKTKMAHQASEELKPFRMGSNHTRNFGILAAVGVVLFILGIVLSLVKLPSEEGEAAAAPAGKEEHHEEGSKPEHHGSAAEKVTAQYASAGMKLHQKAMAMLKGMKQLAKVVMAAMSFMIPNRRAELGAVRSFMTIRLLPIIMKRR